MKRFGFLAIGIALLVTACGPGAEPGAPVSTTVVPAVTTSTIGVTTTTGIAAATTTTLAATTTTAPVTTITTIATPASTTTTTKPHPDTLQVVPYFFMDEAGHPNRQGPFLVPVAREVEYTVGVAAAAVGQLLAGPDSDLTSAVPEISTAIPDGVSLLGLTIDAGLATIDLSSNFAADDDAAAAAQRTAQVVFTLTRFPTVDRVQFRQHGSPVSVQTGSGDLVGRPVTRDDYLEFAAALSVESPVYGGQGRNPLPVQGFGAVFEATFRYELADAEGVTLAEGMAMTSLGTGWGVFDFTIPYTVAKKQVGSLIVFDYSAKDGSAIDIRQYPVTLVP
jgi:spore germination protein GerM